MDQNKAIIGNIDGKISDAKGCGKGNLRHSMSIQYIMAASHFSIQTKMIEENHKGDVFGSFFDEIIWNSTASIMMSTSSLEAYINECILDFFESAATSSDDRKFCEDMIASTSINTIDKYRNLSERKGKKIEKSRLACQNVALLMSLRNELIHFRSEWADDEKRHARISRKLFRKFQGSPFTNQGGNLFPMACFSYSCNRWAIKSTLSFISEFCESAGIPNKFNQFRHRIITD